MAQAYSSLLGDERLKYQVLDETKSLLESIDSPLANHLENAQFSIEKDIVDLILNKETKAARIKINQLSDSNHPKNLSLMGLSYHVDGDFDKAIRYYLMAIDKDEVNAMFNLGTLYQKLEDVNKAVQYYSMAVDKGDVNAMFNLVLLFYKQAIENKQALNLTNNLNSKKPRIHNNCLIALILLWNEEFSESLNYFLSWLKIAPPTELITRATDYFLLLLAKKQYHSALDLFEQDPLLKDKLKPIYFALMRLMKDELPQEHLKAGQELEQTIDEILAEVERYEVKYSLDKVTKDDTSKG